MHESRTFSPGTRIPPSPETTATGGWVASLTASGPVILWMSGAVLAFCGLAVTMRDLSKVLDVFEANAVRTGGGLVGVLLFMAVTGRRAPLHDARNLRDLALRNAVHWGSSLLWTASVALLPLATVFSVEFTTPIWVALLSAVFLGVRTPARTVVAMLVGFAGVLTVVEPGTAGLSARVALPVMTAMGLGLSAMLTKRLTRRNGVTGIIAWMMVLQFSANVAVVAWNDGFAAFATTLSGASWVACDCVGLVMCGLASQVCLTSALRMGDPVTVVSLDFLRIPLIAVVGYLLYGESVGFHTFAGSAAIVGAVLAITAGAGRGRIAALRRSVGAASAPAETLAQTA